MSWVNRIRPVKSCETMQVLEIAEKTGYKKSKIAMELGRSGLLDRSVPNDQWLGHSHGSSDLPIYPVGIDQFPDGLSREKIERLIKETRI